jgi:hypothetical protein
MLNPVPETFRDPITWLSSSLQLQDFMKGAKCYVDLIFRRLTSGHPLEPKAGLDEILNAPAPSFLIGEPNDLIREPGDEWDEDHPRGHFIPE